MIEELGDFGDDVLLVGDEVHEVGVSLLDVDRALAPLRRVVLWVLGGGDERLRSVRYIEAIAQRSLASVRTAPELELLGTQVEDVLYLLRDIALAEPEVQRLRVAEVNQIVSRVDALLGFPLGVEEAQPAKEPARAPKSEPRATTGRGGATRAAPSKGGSARAQSGKRAVEPRREGRGRRPKRATPEVEEVLVQEAELIEDDSLQLSHFESAFEEILPEVRELLATAGVNTVWDLLLMPPSGEEVLRPIHGAGRVQGAGRLAVSGRIRAWSTRCFADGSAAVEALLVGAGPVVLRWAQEPPPWMRERLAPGTRVVLVGDYREGSEELLPVLDQPELAQGDGKQAVRLATYGLELADRLIRDTMRCLAPAIERGGDFLSPAEVEQLKLMPFVAALKEVHARGPERHAAHRRMAFDEALRLQVGLGWNGAQPVRERGLPQTILHGPVASISRQQDLRLNDNQQSVIEDIKRDLRAAHPMQRVLTGEVGTGKGLLALLVSVMVASARGQVLVLHENMGASEHAFLFAEPLLKDLGLVGRLLTGPPTRAQRDAVRRGEVHVTFGTAEMLETPLEFRRLGLIIAHEGAVYGSQEPVIKPIKGTRPDLLVVTSTPVPVQVLLTAFARFDVSLLTPDPNRQPVQSTVVEGANRKEAYREATALLDAGHQAIVVFPMLEGHDLLELRDGHRAVEAIENEFPGRRVGLFHGAMSREDRARVYDNFRHRRLDVLVATTHYEGGPAVPDATVVIVEHANRVDDLRLHRIRGQAATGRRPGRCFFILGDDPAPADVAWVRAVAETEDGFKLSEIHMRNHGIQAVVGDAEVAEPRFRWVRPLEDREVVLQARQLGHQLMQLNSSARRTEWSEFLTLTRQRWEEFLQTPCPIPSQGAAPPKRRRRRRRR
ncbi:MAG: hypothetical protein JXX28_10815 [Deltaproteobacteria bacterium]|nr:hypothetical protein [Deltaproteobacteria bacterium]